MHEVLKKEKQNCAYSIIELKVCVWGDIDKRSYFLRDETEKRRLYIEQKG